MSKRPLLVYLAALSFVLMWATERGVAHLIVKHTTSSEVLRQYEAIRDGFGTQIYVVLILALLVFSIIIRIQRLSQRRLPSYQGVIHACLHGLPTHRQRLPFDSFNRVKAARRWGLTPWAPLIFIIIICGYAGWTVLDIAGTAQALNRHEPRDFTVQILDDEHDIARGTRYTAVIVQPNEYKDYRMYLITKSHTDNMALGKLYCIRGSWSPTKDAYREQSLQQGIVGTVQVQKATGIPTPSAHLLKTLDVFQTCAYCLSDARLFAQDILGARIDQAHGLMAALAIGDKRGLTTDALNEDLQITGLSHVVAVSGMHLSVLIACITRLTDQAKSSYRVRLGLVVVISAAYLLVTGAQFSTLRAYTMVIAIILARFCGRHSQALSALSLAVLAILLVHPLAATSVSLQLSALCVLGLILFSSPISAWLHRWCPSPLLKLPGVHSLLECIGVSIAAQVATAWLVVCHMHRVSLIATVANAFVLGLIPLVLVGSLLLILLSIGCKILLYPAALSSCADHIPIELSSFGPLLVQLFRILGQFCSSIVNHLHSVLLELSALICTLIHALASVPFASVPCTLRYACAVIIITLVGFICLKKLTKRSRYLLSLLALGMVCVTAGYLFVHTYTTSITMLDIGQGDAFLLKSQGKTMLIDTGPHRSVVSELQSMDITHIDLLVLTHLDNDHVGGLCALAQYAKVDAVVLSKGVYAHLSAEQMRALERMGVEHIYEVVQKDRLQYSGFTIYVWGPNHPHSGEENEDSLVCHVTLHPSVFPALMGEGMTMCCTGDAPATLVSTYLKTTHINGCADVLKVSHHGAKNGTDDELLGRIKPRIALINCGIDNPYHHPHLDCLKSLTKNNILYFVSARDGRTSVMRKKGVLCVE